jgi:hypothetical protein
VAEEEDMTRDKSQIEKPNVDYLFYLSELAFAIELALAKAQEDSVFRIRSAADYRMIIVFLPDTGILPDNIYIINHINL